MPRLRVADLLKAEISTQTLKVSGWVRSMRAGKDVAFMAISDGSSLAVLQVVAESSMPDFEKICRIGTGSAVTVYGTLQESPAKGQSVELAAEKIELVGAADESYPLQKKRHSFEYLRTIAHLRPRTNTIGAVARVPRDGREPREGRLDARVRALRRRGPVGRVPLGLRGRG